MQSIEHLLALRESAAARGDLGLVREITSQLQREGYIETAVTGSFETATPKRGPGRPRKDAA